MELAKKGSQTEGQRSVRSWREWTVFPTKEPYMQRLRAGGNTRSVVRVVVTAWWKGGEVPDGFH